MSVSRLFNFQHQFVKYGEFHANKVNQGIHLIFVPLILWTGTCVACIYLDFSLVQVWLVKTPVYLAWKYGNYLPINGAFIGKTFGVPTFMDIMLSSLYNIRVIVR